MRRTFGDQVFDPETSKIDRAKLGQVIFADPAKRRQLDKLSHPRIYRRILVTLFKLKFLEKRPLVVLDAPLLFESKLLEYLCYPILVVYCEKGQEQLKRLMERNSLAEEDAMRKISSQMPITVKVRRADIAIDNTGSPKQLRKQVMDTVIPKIYQKLGYIDTVNLNERKED